MIYPKGFIKAGDVADKFEVEPEKLIAFAPSTMGSSIYTPGGSSITARASGNFAGKALFLPNMYDYKIVTDSEGYLVLLVIKK